jgi:hypothetical protein
MRLWTAEHLGVSPASKTIRALDEWQVGLIYEIAMNYPVEGLRRSYFDRKQSIEAIDDEEFLEMGYSIDEIIEMKKGKE